ncbi:hypothetical protein [Xylophilus sp. Leaf220]|uniref:hypothetical protein n=1 Tax=Xylophilus sp. Leaf220 TaxID=1735686 RepID=UPI0012E32AA8|nr:hypothetical protein [Xylophilus sp. Leaf220]
MLTVDMDSKRAGRVRVTYCATSSKHYKSVSYFWTAVHAGPVPSAPLDPQGRVRRTPEQVLAAIDAADRVGQGRVLASVDWAQHDAEGCARDSLTVRLHGVDASGRIKHDDIVRARDLYREAMERVFGGPVQLLAAVQAAKRHRVGDDLLQGDIELMKKWQSRAAQTRGHGLVDLPPELTTRAWFELGVRPPPDTRAAAARIQAAREAAAPRTKQINLF